MSYNWNYGDIIDGVGTVVPGARPALIHGERVVTWHDFVARTNNLAAGLLRGGAQPGDKIAFYMRNCPEYPQGMAAGFKARLTHVNVNYRYVEAELVYLLDDADATVCMYTAEFAPQVSRIRDKLPKVNQWVEVSDGHPGLDDSIPFESLATSGNGGPLDIERSTDDHIFVYTGGTTGMPKGAMWRHFDLWNVMGAGGNSRAGVPGCATLEEHLARVAAARSGPVNLPLPPIMHGTGLVSALAAMTSGGTCITLTSRSFEPELALAEIARHKVNAVAIVGDAFARPMLDALDEHPGKYDISSVTTITSSGVMWTKDVKAGLLRHNPDMMLIDGFSSSEAIGIGSSVMTKDAAVEVAKFTLGPSGKVFTEDLREVTPGSGESGMVAVTGFLPVGFYKDQQKTDATFKTINGVRYSIPGDWVRVEADGSLTLLGRGSSCINTAGEKVYPEEVEEAIKHHDSVADCLVVGVHDDQWGQSITAVVQLNEGYELEEIDLKDFVRTHLAGYKIPKRILVKDDLERAPNGKANYKVIRDFAESALGIG